MKLHTKLLTILLPVATVATVAPIAVSCSSSSTYVLKYGSNLQTTESGKDNYVSLDDLKKGAKNACNIYNEHSVTQTYLGNVSDEQKYYDLIASIVFNAAAKSVILSATTVTYVVGDATKTADTSKLSYSTDVSKAQIQIQTDGTAVCASRMFSSVTEVKEA